MLQNFNLYFHKAPLVPAVGFVDTSRTFFFFPLRDYYFKRCIDNWISLTANSSYLFSKIQEYSYLGMFIVRFPYVMSGS